MMVLLPLQWSWAAVGSICEHEPDGGHFGHHVHQHDEPAPEAVADVAAEGDAVGNHPDCEACHGLGAGIPTAAAGVDAPWADGAQVSNHGHDIPDPPVESLLRPPLTLVA